MKLQELIHKLKAEYEKWGDVEVALSAGADAFKIVTVDSWPGPFYESMFVVILGKEPDQVLRGYRVLEAKARAWERVSNDGQKLNLRVITECRAEIERVEEDGE